MPGPKSYGEILGPAAALQSTGGKAGPFLEKHNLGQPKALLNLTAQEGHNRRAS